MIELCARLYPPLRRHSSFPFFGATVFGTSVFHVYTTNDDLYEGFHFMLLAAKITSPQEAQF